MPGLRYQVVALFAGDGSVADEAAGSSTDERPCDTESDESDEEHYFDVGLLDLPAECDMIAQDRPDGEKCIAYGQWGGVVEATDDCDANSMCWEFVFVGEDVFGTCVPFCTGNPCVDAVLLPNCAGSNCCTNFCDLDLGDAQCSEPGTFCIAFYDVESAPPGDEDVGGMSRILTMVALLLAGCVPEPPSLDEEAGVTTNFGEEDSTGGDSTDEDSTTGGSTTTGDENTSSSDDEFVFIEIGDIICALPCDVFQQDCPRGEKCVPYASSVGGGWDSNKCVPILGDRHAGESCMSDGINEATDDCDASSICWADVCTAFCGGTADDPECPLDESCLTTGEGSASLCVDNCDPLAQDCAAGQGCYWGDWDFGCIPTIGEIPTGEPCGYINDCAPGNMCIDADMVPDCLGAACCANFCDLGLGDSQCAALPGTACVPFFELDQAPPGYEHFGICILLP